MLWSETSRSDALCVQQQDFLFECLMSCICPQPLPLFTLVSGCNFLKWLQQLYTMILANLWTLSQQKLMALFPSLDTLRRTEVVVSSLASDRHHWHLSLERQGYGQNISKAECKEYGLTLMRLRYLHCHWMVCTWAFCTARMKVRVTPTLESDAKVPWLQLPFLSWCFWKTMPACWLEGVHSQPAQLLHCRPLICNMRRLRKCRGRSSLNSRVRQPSHDPNFEVALPFLSSCGACGWDVSIGG